MKKIVENTSKYLAMSKEENKEFLDKMCIRDRKYPAQPFSLELKDQYYNMREVIEKNFEVVELAKKAMESLNIEPKIIPIRGGTDGARPVSYTHHHYLNVVRYLNLAKIKIKSLNF